MGEHLFTSESVTEGHPDKICDRIADAILDDILENDSQARVACEVMANTGMLLVFGEITTAHYCDLAGLARRTLRRIGYSDHCGFSAETCAVLVSIDEQSPDIAAGVGESLEVREGSADPLDGRGAGDQGIMFGYACTESEVLAAGSFMPLPIMLAHTLARRLAEVRHSHALEFLKPDGKTQVTVRYDGLAPQLIETVLISAQHVEGAQYATMREAVLEHVVRSVLPAQLTPAGDGLPGQFLFNPAGLFVKGGPEADSGLTGRKIIVDTYGGSARHGGGSFSGKDPTKVDRSASYYARYIAKNLVAAGAAERLELQVSYAIGRARPLGIAVDCQGTALVDEGRILSLLEHGGLFDFRPAAIIERLGLLDVRYEPVAAYGHFGRTDLDLPWERLDLVDAIRQELKL